MKNLSKKDIIDIITKSNNTPSKNWQGNTLNKLKELSFENSNENWTYSPFSLYPNFINMRKTLSFVVVILLVVLAGRYYLSPVSQANNHLNKARAALAQLQNYTQGESFTMINRSELLPSAFAEEEATEKTEEILLEEEVIEELVETVVEETEAAIEETEEVGDTEDTAELLEKIDEVQDETVEVLSDVLEDVESETVAETVAEAIEETVETNEEIEEVQEAVQEAFGTGKEEVEIKVETNRERQHEQTQEKIRKAEQLMEGLNAGEMELNQNMQKKYNAIQAILEECSLGEKCQAGKAKGLATALNAKVQNKVRKTEKGKDNKTEEKVIEDEENSEVAEEEDENTEEEVAEESEENTEEEVAEEATEAIRAKNKEDKDDDRNSSKTPGKSKKD